MIVEPGRVVELDNAAAWVICERQAGCERCMEGRGCGGGLIGRWLGGRLHRVRAIRRPPDVSIGDCVLLGLEPSALVRGALLVYGLPLAMLIAGALLGALIWQAGSELPVLLVSAAGLISGLALVRHLSHRWTENPRYHPVILRRLDE